jgi:hypothetical protein
MGTPSAHVLCEGSFGIYICTKHFVFLFWTNLLLIISINSIFKEADTKHILQNMKESGWELLGKGTKVSGWKGSSSRLGNDGNVGCMH